MLFFAYDYTTKYLDESSIQKERIFLSIKNKNIVFANDRFYQDMDGKRLDWFEAKDYCSNLTLYDTDDWYVPEKSEFSALYKTTRINDFIGVNNEPYTLFQYIKRSGNYYWTSNTYTKDGLDTSAITSNGFTWSKNKKFSVICATQDDITQKNDEIIEYKVVKKARYSIDSNKLISNNLKSQIKKCTNRLKGWRFNETNKVVCTNTKIF